MLFSTDLIPDAVVGAGEGAGAAVERGGAVTVT